LDLDRRIVIAKDLRTPQGRRPVLGDPGRQKSSGKWVVDCKRPAGSSEGSFERKIDTNPLSDKRG
jgi:hypothetical protein